MIWRGIILIFAHITAVLLLLAGLSWLERGVGLNPLIAFPGCTLVFAWSWIWILHEAAEADVQVTEYLEWLDEQERNCTTMRYMDNHYNTDTVKGSLIQIMRSRDFWS